MSGWARAIPRITAPMLGRLPGAIGRGFKTLGKYSAVGGAGYGAGRLLRNVAAKSSKSKKRKNKIKKRFTGQGAEGHSISTSSSVGRKKKLTFAQKVIREALPEVSRSTYQLITTWAQGQQVFYPTHGAGSAAWDYSTLNLYAPAASGAIKRFYVDGFQYKSTYCNFTNFPIQITLYDLKCIRTAGTQAQPDITVGAGLNEKYSSTNEYQVPGVSPFESSDFKRHWKVIGTKTITLSPGENHQHFLKIDIKKYYKSDDAREESVDQTSTIVTPTYVKDFSYTTLYRCVGTVVTDDTLVSYCSGKIGVITDQKLTWRRPQGASTTQLLAAQSSYPPITLTAQKNILMETGATITDGTA